MKEEFILTISQELEENFAAKMLDYYRIEKYSDLFDLLIESYRKESKELFDILNEDGYICDIELHLNEENSEFLRELCIKTPFEEKEQALIHIFLWNCIQFKEKILKKEDE